MAIGDSFCNPELRSFEQRLNDFRTRGVQIAAISVDSNAQSRKLCQDRGYTFMFPLRSECGSDPPLWRLSSGAGENGHDIARPAEFLIDASGAIRWVNLTDDIRVRARPAVILPRNRRPPAPMRILTPSWRRHFARCAGTPASAKSSEARLRFHPPIFACRRASSANSGGHEIGVNRRPSAVKIASLLYTQADTRQSVQCSKRTAAPASPRS